MLVPNRHESSGEYRYGFNGKEKDDELKGEGNSYDFGARMYDPRVGRWFAPDPLFKKYADISPYNYTNNNPILFVDYDGNDFGILIDHVNKTILIVADIYTTSSSTYKQAHKAAQQWNQKSVTTDGYKVMFSVSVHKESKSAFTDAQLLANKNARYGAAANDALKDKLGVSNIYAGLDGRDSNNVDGTSSSFVGGVTANGQRISMNNEVNLGDLGGYEDLVAHEIGHLFGLDDEDGNGDKNIDPYFGGDKGIMKYKGLNLNPPSDTDVYAILDFAVDLLSKRIKNPETEAKIGFVVQFGDSDGCNPLNLKNNTNEQTPLENLPE